MGLLPELDPQKTHTDFIDNFQIITVTLRRLDFSCSIEPLAGTFNELKSLTILKLRSTKVTDAGMKEIGQLRNLTALYLDFTSVSDVGLQELNKLEKLTRLDLFHTRVINVGAMKLKASLPNLKINR